MINFSLLYIIVIIIVYRYDHNNNDYYHRHSWCQSFSLTIIIISIHNNYTIIVQYSHNCRNPPRLHTHTHTHTYIHIRTNIFHFVLVALVAAHKNFVCFFFLYLLTWLLLRYLSVTSYTFLRRWFNQLNSFLNEQPMMRRSCSSLLNFALETAQPTQNQKF